MAGVIMSTLLIAGLALTGGAVILILTDHHESSLREYAILGLFCSILPQRSTRSSSVTSAECSSIPCC